MASESEAAPKPKRLYHQKKVLETILHGLLILCVAFVPYIYWNEPHTIALFVGCLVVVHFWVIGVKQLAAVIGLKLSNLMYSAGIVERPPIKENKSQMLKWQDQAWQLAIHVTMTAGEVSFRYQLLRNHLIGLDRKEEIYSKPYFRCRYTYCGMNVGGTKTKCFMHGYPIRTNSIR